MSPNGISFHNISGSDMSADVIEDEFLPLSEATFFLLLSLAQSPKHGYAIMKDVQQLSQQRIMLSTGTLYGALKRLLEQGWIARSDDEAIDSSGRQQKVYILTARGHAVLAAEVTRLQSLVQAATNRRVMGTT
jgi:DNA-binding PadR family transcriptional regulator